jgi:hypothetical protein
MNVPGYHIKTEKGLNLDKFLQTYFPGFDALVVSKQAEQLLTPMATTPLQREWQFSDPPPRITFWLLSEDAFNEQTGLSLARTFRSDEQGINVHHDYFTIPEQYRGRGTSKAILKAWLELYVQMNVQKIFVHAALQDGGYVWARAGFKAVKQNEVDRILTRAKANLTPIQFTTIQSYYDDHYNNFPGQPFPMEYWGRMRFMKDTLRASSWHGEIDLTNQQELTNFRNYVSA